MRFRHVYWFGGVSFSVISRVRSGSRSNRGPRKIQVYERKTGCLVTRARARHVMACLGVKVKADFCLL
jgi:hypothetical protein